MAGHDRINAGDRSKAARLRTLLAGGRLVRAVGAHDGLTAKLVERAGFEAVWMSGFALSASHAIPDASLLTLTEHLRAAENIDSAVELPVIADCDTGFGGPLNVAYTVQRYERAGIAAICIEDKVFPKYNSFADRPQHLVSTEDFTDKIKAGKDAQRDDAFMLIARTETFIAGGSVTEAVERASAYAEAGADAILVHSKKSAPDEILDFAARWSGQVPLVAVPTTYYTVHEKTLSNAGYHVVIYANQGVRAAIRGIQDVLRVLSEEGSAATVNDRIVPIVEVFSLQELAGKPGRPK